MNKVSGAKVILAGTMGLALLSFVPHPHAVFAQRTRAAESNKPAGAQAPAADQEIGKQFRISADELPKPKATPAVSNGPLALPFQDQTPKVPEGFRATLFAKLEHPRRLLVLPNGDIIVAEQKPGYLTLLRGKDGNGESTVRSRVAGRPCAGSRSGWHLEGAARARQRAYWPWA
jgi:glucose/arabinose dehydrogenase